jgi:deoxyribonuclease (pyrimidine dimer)
MTRVNVVPVEELCDKHLLAEYRELPRVFKLARQRLPGEKFPTAYTLGAGHIKFFYDKLLFLTARFTDIVNECEKRGFNIKYFSVLEFLTWAPPILYKTWTPTPEALALNRARLAERISQFKRPSK